MVASIAAALAAELLAGHMEATKAQLSHSAHASSGSGGQEINDRCPWCNSRTHHGSGCLSAARHRAIKPDCITHVEIAQELEQIISQIGTRPTWVTAEMLRAVIRRLG